MSSFNKGNKSVYDRELPQILDDSLHATEQSEKLFSRIQCMVSKITTLENLSVPCL
ncbi:MAG: hypothetical protein H6767_03085 [Candidatus Peribacteria bacterium]|nr:MAG: hypothetical protein H6767_03085 [Candidatus Peribacteria bacterium]